MSPAAPRVLVASADRLYADALCHLLAANGWELAGVATDGVRSLALANSSAPSAVVVVGDLPRIGPSALARRLRARWPSLTIVTVGGDAPGGAHHHLPATVTAGDLLLALQGASPIDQEEAPSPRRSGLALVSRLTPRERQTFMLLAQGLSREEIAAHTRIRPHTVRTHIQHVYEKLGLHDRVQLVRFAAEHGLVDHHGAGEQGGESRSTR